MITITKYATSIEDTGVVMGYKNCLNTIADEIDHLKKERFYACISEANAPYGVASNESTIIGVKIEALTEVYYKIHPALIHLLDFNKKYEENKKENK